VTISRRGNRSWVHQAVVLHGQAVPACGVPVRGLDAWQALPLHVAANCEACADAAEPNGDDNDDGYFDAVNEPLVVWR
jgi:hypothetical protein